MIIWLPSEIAACQRSAARCWTLDTVYLSQDRARVPLATESDLTAAIDAGLLEESHFLDLKREAKSGKAPNRETARDLASFAVDGGTVIIGLEEANDGLVQLAPQPLAGLAERIEQIAAMIPDPPLAVIARPIPTDADRTLGYLVVHVPASPSAPHMIDGRYLGRGDKTKRYLSDGEVLRLHQQRTANEVDGLALLAAEFERDIFNDDDRKHGHLFLVAEPLNPRSDMLLNVTDTDTYEALMAFRQKGLTPELQRLLGAVGAADVSPGLNEMQTIDRRGAGAAWSTYGIAPGRQPQTENGYKHRESDAELEIADSGALRIYSSRLTDGDDERQMFFDATAVGLTRRLIALVEAAAETAGYFGNWVLAVGATGLKGSFSYKQSQAWGGSDASPYADDTYKRAIVASYSEVVTKPGDLTGRLVAPLLRAYKSRQHYQSIFKDPDRDSAGTLADD